MVRGTGARDGSKRTNIPTSMSLTRATRVLLIASQLGMSTTVTTNWLALLVIRAEVSVRSAVLVEVWDSFRSKEKTGKTRN